MSTATAAPRTGHRPAGNAALVAPVIIGKDATITSAAPADKLTVARARQATIEGWRRPRKKPK